jgi:hypothetical protein
MPAHELGQHLRLDSQLPSEVQVFLQEFSLIDDFSGQAPCFITKIKGCFSVKFKSFLAKKVCLVLNLLDLHKYVEFSTTHSWSSGHLTFSHGSKHSQSSQLFKLLTRPYLQSLLHSLKSGHLLLPLF